ncbi:MAG: hypothetical protein KAH18_02540 [Psychromonas sp.]|nr:hypothetical protein [Psychromonas sp.]
MNKNKQIFELYIDHHVTSLSYTSATGLSNLLDGENSHNQNIRFYLIGSLARPIYGKCKKRSA